MLEVTERPIRMLQNTNGKESKEEKPQVIPDVGESRIDHTLQTTYPGMPDRSSTCLPLLGKPGIRRTPNQPSTNHMATNGRDLGFHWRPQRRFGDIHFHSRTCFTCSLDVEGLPFLSELACNILVTS